MHNRTQVHDDNRTGTRENKQEHYTRRQQKSRENTRTGSGGHKDRHKKTQGQAQEDSRTDTREYKAVVKDTTA